MRRWWWWGAFGCAVGWGARRPWPGSPCCGRGGRLPSQRCTVAMFCCFFWLLTLNLQDGTLALCGTSQSCRCLWSVAVGRGTVELRWGGSWPRVGRGVRLPGVLAGLQAAGGEQNLTQGRAAA